VQAVFNRATTNESSTTSVAFNTQNITEETLVSKGIMVRMLIV